jgi:hypothetical protein
MFWDEACLLMSHFFLYGYLASDSLLESLPLILLIPGPTLCYEFWHRFRRFKFRGANWALWSKNTLLALHGGGCAH